jgi:DNA-binding response OmpR family regulator
LKILVVEGQRRDTEALGFFCSARKNIDCQSANTGREGLDRIRKDDFDLILLDLACLTLADWT